MGEKDSQRLTTLTLTSPPLDAMPFLTDDEVSPLDDTALVTAVSIPSNVRLETSRLGPKMTGPTKTEDRWGIKLPHHWDREFPRSPERARTGSALGDVGSEISRVPEVENL